MLMPQLKLLLIHTVYDQVEHKIILYYHIEKTDLVDVHAYRYLTVR